MKSAEVLGFGGVERLVVHEVPDPRPGPGEVLVRNGACGLNHSDLLMREGLYLGGPKPPFRPGVEAAGVVEALGEGSDPALLGQRVVMLGEGGLHAELAVVPAVSCIPLPGGLAMTDAAALPVAWLTAYQALTTVGRARAGETVVIHGAAGGVGTAAIQIAHKLGLRVVATASTEAKRARVDALGADVVVGYERFEVAVRQLTDCRGPELILETIGGDLLRRSLRLLAPLGRLVVIGFASREPQPIDTVQLLYRSQAVLGCHLNAVVGTPERVHDAMAQILRWVTTGDVQVPVSEIRPLAEIRGAHERLASRESWGKIVLVP